MKSFLNRCLQGLYVPILFSGQRKREELNMNKEDREALPNTFLNKNEEADITKD